MDVGIYAHVPFCARKCDYCDFFVTVGPRHDEPRFFDFLRRDLDRDLRRLEDASGAPPSFDTLYFGGGTPSYVEPAGIGEFVAFCRRRMRAIAEVECTLEANPESVTAPSAEAWRHAGVNRLSLGFQSLRTEVLRPRGRVYTGEEACRALRTARQAGFDNIGVDLIAGLPGESVASFREGIDRLLALQPDHVSIYLLETEESLKHTPLSKALREGRVPPADDDALCTMYTEGCNRLVGAGYRHYEISNFCRPGRESRHNIKYWRSTPWFGVGPSACSFLQGRRRVRPGDLAAWERAVEEDLLSEAAEGGAPEGAWREALILELRLNAGVSPVDFRARWGHDPTEVMDAIEGEPGMEGLLERAEGRHRLSARGRLLSNEVFARLL